MIQDLLYNMNDYWDWMRKAEHIMLQTSCDIGCSPVDDCLIMGQSTSCYFSKMMKTLFRYALFSSITVYKVGKYDVYSQLRSQ